MDFDINGNLIPSTPTGKPKKKRFDKLKDVQDKLAVARQVVTDLENLVEFIQKSKCIKHLE